MTGDIRLNRPLLISASRRTDLPAFYSEWFMDRVRKGFLKTHNPFSHKEILVSLKPEDVGAVVFWTKNFSPMMKYLDELENRGFFCLVHYTITGLGRDFEPKAPASGEAVKNFRQLSERLGPERVLWRFDPIVLSERLTGEETLVRFSRLCSELAESTHRVYFSFVELYARVRRRIKHYENATGDRVMEPGLVQKQKISARLAELAHSRGMSIYACCEPELSGFGIEQAHCIDADFIFRLTGRNFEHKSSPTRKSCGCDYALDIGAYDSCPHLCWYCYANSHPALVRKRHGAHRPQAEFLVE
jgi:DNA repair photolyase